MFNIFKKNLFLALISSIVFMVSSCSDDSGNGKEDPTKTTGGDYSYISSVDLFHSTYTNTDYIGYEYDYSVEKINSLGQKQPVDKDNSKVDVKISCVDRTILDKAGNIVIDKEKKMFAVKKKAVETVVEKADTCFLVLNISGNSATTEMPIDLSETSSNNDFINVTSTNESVKFKGSKILIDDEAPVPSTIDFNVELESGKFEINESKITIKKDDSITIQDITSTVPTNENLSFEKGSNNKTFKYSIKNQFPEGVSGTIIIRTSDNKNVIFYVHFGMVDLSGDFLTIQKLAPGSTQNLRVAKYILKNDHIDFEELSDIQSITCERAPNNDDENSIAKDVCEKVHFQIDKDGNNYILYLAVVPEASNTASFNGKQVKINFKNSKNKSVAFADVYLRHVDIDKSKKLPFLLGFDTYTDSVVEIPYSDKAWKFVNKTNKTFSVTISIVQGYAKYNLSNQKLTVSDVYTGSLKNISFTDSKDENKLIHAIKTDSGIDCLNNTNQDRTNCILSYKISYIKPNGLVDRGKAAEVKVLDNSNPELSQTFKLYTVAP